MLPAEVILDRWIKERRSRHEPAFDGYHGKLDIEQVESPSFKSSLYRIQDTLNEAFRLARPDASGAGEHPSFHFDYLDVDPGIKNAHAFQQEGFSFIVVTLPMVEWIFHVSKRLSRAPVVLKLSQIVPEARGLDNLHVLLFELQLAFLVSHEYAHHIDRHCLEDAGGALGVWSEFPLDGARNGINSQAMELNADGYAAYLVLAHHLRGDGRQSAARQLNRAELLGTDGDELLLTCFLIAILAFFCAFWQGGADAASLQRGTHPPPPVRIKYLCRVTEMWCSQNGSLPSSWFAPSRLEVLFSAAVDPIAPNARQTWDADLAALRSEDGLQYEGLLFERFEAVRKAGRQVPEASVRVRPD